MTSSQGGAFRHTWFVGGSFLLGSLVLGWNSHLPSPVVSVISVLGTMLFAAALLVFAFGFRRAESVTARRPLGTAALTILAVWVLLSPLLTDVLLSGPIENEPSSALIVYSLIDPYLRFALALVAAMQVGRTPVVPAPWNWAPAWALAVLTVPWVLGQVVTAGTSPESDPTLMMYLTAFDALARSICTVVLGVVAILLADRVRRPARQPSHVAVG
ncbi:hypothetical protein [Mycetocola miduiensis]|uniref:Uncharacterized protein n=1 Tax=Mycetocola miduiensis TaxID=995034 RepID=A0A1I5DNH5_9MICO|nr:hypothetical protein [Mycetocola miduiensis]SFO00748.1 hypothetical protein SAMN05216219_3005 [Mycetocola miduiensis]